MDIIELSKIIDSKGIFEILELENKRAKIQTRIFVPRITVNSGTVDLMNELVKLLNGKFKKYGSTYKMSFDGAVACDRVLLEILPFLEKKSAVAITMADFIDFCKSQKRRDALTFVEKREFKKQIDALNEEFRKKDH